MVLTSLLHAQPRVGWRQPWAIKGTTPSALNYDCVANYSFVSYKLRHFIRQSASFYSMICVILLGNIWQIVMTFYVVSACFLH